MEKKGSTRRCVVLEKATGSKKKGRKKCTQMSLCLLKPCSRRMGQRRRFQPDLTAGLGKVLVALVALVTGGTG